MNKQDHRKEQKRMKLLLLGTGESGKSTIFKQMKILYGADKGYTSKEREQYKPPVYSNIFSNLKCVVDYAEKHGAIQNMDSKNAFLSLVRGDDEPAPEITESIAATLKDIWHDEGIQAAWKNRGNYQVQDCKFDAFGNDISLAKTD